MLGGQGVLCGSAQGELRERKIRSWRAVVERGGHLESIRVERVDGEVRPATEPMCSAPLPALASVEVVVATVVGDEVVGADGSTEPLEAIVGDVRDHDVV